MRRMWAVGAAIVMCLVLSAVPGASQSALPTTGTAWVSGTQDCSVVDEGTRTVVDGVTLVRDQAIDCVKTMTDPRVSGTSHIQYNHDDHGAAGVTFWGTEEIIGPDGTWRGTFMGVIDASGNAGGIAVKEGTGAYSGWTFIDTPQGQGMTATLAGTIFQGPPQFGPQPWPSAE
jgi:hypothetical protein